MSYRLVDSVLDLEGMYPADKLVLAQLAKKANDDGLSCYPGEHWLAMTVGISERKVRDALKHLELHGYLSIKRRGYRQTNNYKLTIDRGLRCSILRSKCLNRTSGSDQKHAVLDRTPGSYNSVSTTSHRRLRRPGTRSPSKESLTRSESRPDPRVRSREQEGNYKFQHCTEDERGHSYKRSCRECVDREGRH